MSETTQAETRKSFQNLDGSNAKQKEIARLRSVALDEGESPTERLVAAAKLLSRFGPTRRNSQVIRDVIKLFIEYGDYSVVERAKKLKIKLAKAKGLKEEKTELPDREPTATEESPAIVAGTSASEVPGPLPLTRDGINQVIRKVTGALSYEGLPDITTLSITQQNLIIEVLVHGCGLSLSPSEIKSVIDDLERQGLAGSFPGLIQVARRYLAVTINLLEALNRRDFSGVLQ
jgi:hypothetical protein